MSGRSKLRIPGLVAGLALAPVVGLGSYLRHARLFHPSGTVLHGMAYSLDTVPSEHDAGAVLVGPVFARFSGAWWRSREWPDVLGCALRFTKRLELGALPGPGDQDLLFATIRNPLTTLLAPISTHTHDYLRNDYFGVAPFRVPVLGVVKLRLSPLEPAPPASTRERRLLRALEFGPIRLLLEARSNSLGSRYRPIARIELVEHVQVDAAALRFDPFATGRGFMPVGFVHAMRVASYAASRAARGA